MFTLERWFCDILVSGDQTQLEIADAFTDVLTVSLGKRGFWPHLCFIWSHLADSFMPCSVLNCQRLQTLRNVHISQKFSFNSDSYFLAVSRHRKFKRHTCRELIHVIQKDMCHVYRLKNTLNITIYLGSGLGC